MIKSYHFKLFQPSISDVSHQTRLLTCCFLNRGSMSAGHKYWITNSLKAAFPNNKQHPGAKNVSTKKGTYLVLLFRMVCYIHAYIRMQNFNLPSHIMYISAYIDIIEYSITTVIIYHMIIDDVIWTRLQTGGYLLQTPLTLLGLTAQIYSVTYVICTQLYFVLFSSSNETIQWIHVTNVPIITMTS